MSRHKRRVGRDEQARRYPLLVPALLLGVGFAGCDFLDPTNVENPRTTDEDLAQSPDLTGAFLPGLRAQFARMVGSQVVISEVTSDNYSVHGTGISSVWGNPRDVRPTDMDATTFTQGIYWNMQELRALADFVLDEVVPGDTAGATPERLAEIHYYRGMAYLLQGETFTHVPTEQDGPPRPASELLERAIADLEASLDQSGTGDLALPAWAGIARAHRALGNAGPAVEAAAQVLAADPAFAFQQFYDATSVENQPHIYLVVRALKEMQPLPRLDFLDPKYLSREAGIAVAKAEEMHLIFAEAALADDDLAAARGHLANAIGLALGRATTSFVDDDPRLNDDLTVRPRNASMLVRADAQSPFRAGLILDRPGAQIMVPTVSATSLNPDSVLALTDPDEVWHAFYLARQEILILEGRRMSDLGIRLPMMLREIDQNPSINDGDPGTIVVVPAYIPMGTEMNAFDPKSPYADEEGEIIATTEVTIRHDMNRILAENRVNAFVN